MKHHIETLCRQHAELRALAIQYELELAKPAPDLPALAKCRWTLARLISAHLAYEDAYLYPTLERFGGRASELGRSISREMGDLGTQLGDHVRKWTSDMILSDWTAFTRSSKALMAMLKARMDREENEAYPLIMAAKAA
jgi:hypothetical protein